MLTQSVSETPTAPTGAAPDAAGCNFRDPAFTANRDAPVHRWTPWIAGFSKQFVEDALDCHAPAHSVVLDSFAGVGTTLLEADLAGHEAVGFEINPYAAFACRAKLAAHRVDSPPEVAWGRGSRLRGSDVVLGDKGDGAARRPIRGQVPAYAGMTVKSGGHGAGREAGGRPTPAPSSPRR